MRERGLIFLICMALLALCLSGCSPISLVETQTEFDVALPTPLSALAPRAPVGDARTEAPIKATLMYLSDDGQRLMPQEPTFWLTEDQTLLEQVVMRLLTGPSTEARPAQPSDDGQSLSMESVRPIAPAGTKLLSADLVCGIATINLSGQARIQTQQEMVYMRAALVNTVSRLPGVSYVNVLIDGQVEGMGEQIVSMPNGALSYIDAPLPAIWLQVMTDEERMLLGDPSQQMELTAVLYYASVQDERLVPVARHVNIRGNNMIMPLLQELARDIEGMPSIRRVFPEGVDPLVAVPMITSSPDGRRVINLLLDASFEDNMRERNLSLTQFYGALTLTMTRFVPEVDGVVVRIGNRRVDALDDGRTFSNGVMTAEDFEAAIGDIAGIYLSNGEGKLRRVERVLASYAAVSPRTLIEEILKGMAKGETGLFGVMPEGVSIEDVLGIGVENGAALINLSSNFYRCAQQLDEQAERLLIYSIVNTLTDLQGIDRVRIYVEGEPVDTLAHSIYLRTELIRNPGIIAE